MLTKYYYIKAFVMHPAFIVVVSDGMLALFFEVVVNESKSQGTMYAFQKFCTNLPSKILVCIIPDQNE